MKASEVITMSRVWLDDEVEPYKWKTSELIDYLNDALNKVSIEADYFLDPSTTAIVQLTLADGTRDYAFDDRILQIESIRLTSQDRYLEKYSAREFELYYGPDWLTDEETPVDYCLDYRTGYVSFRPVPDATYTANLTTKRNHYTLITSANMASTDIAVASEFHLRMADYICYRAYLKAGSATFKPDVSAVHKTLFDGLVFDIKRYLIKLFHRQRCVRPRYGNM